VPHRTCVACRTERAKRDLIRVVRAAGTGELTVDLRGKSSGRGAYLCPDAACLERGLADGSVGRALGTTIDEPTRERLRVELADALAQRT
jgi:hypothetical protein